MANIYLGILKQFLLSLLRQSSNPTCNREFTDTIAVGHISTPVNR
jgi:hypothetical protein